MNKFVIYLLIVFPLLSCTRSPETCEDTDRECLTALMENHVARKSSYWEKFYDNPLNERVFVAPKEVIEYINLDNRKNGFPNRPFTPRVSEEFVQDIKDAISEIPDSVKAMLESKFAGVFLLSDLGGTGYTDYILNENGDPVAAFVILDFQVLQKRDANEWATWKESTPFKADPSFSIEAIIQPDATDNRKYAIQYILLHELGHVISVDELFHPPWTIFPNGIRQVEKYEFFNESWRIDKQDNEFVSRFDTGVLPNRENVVYYFGAKLNGNQMHETYTALEETDFPTLYAATHPTEDWAESFVTYVHSVLMQKPLLIRIKKDGEVVKEIYPCWGTPRCANKEAILAALFGKAQ